MSDTSELRKAYAEALKRLRNNHSEEFHQILEGIYVERGITVQKRLTGVRKKKADLEKAKALVAALEAELDS